MIASYGLHLARPWWLLAAALAIPAVVMAWKNLAPLGRVRRFIAAGLRVTVIVLLAIILAAPSLARKGETVTVIAVVDRSRSIPEALQEASLNYLAEAARAKPPGDRLAMIDVAEQPTIARLPSTATDVPKRNTMLFGQQTNLAAGVQMAMAVAPPDSATRILLISDGNETAGDLREAARLAAANGVPIDVLPLQYTYQREVAFRRLVVPTRARSGQTIPIRMVLTSTAETTGRLLVTLNGETVDVDPTSPEVTAPVRLKPGTNVSTISLPVARSGMHEFVATFLPDDPSDDQLVQNNRASGMTFVAGPGQVLVVDEDGQSAQPLVDALGKSNIEVRYISARQFPVRLADLLDADAVVLVNVSNSAFTHHQQELLSRYVIDLGGGLIMTGGPDAFGAGGWIGSPVAEILPIDLDPPQKKRMPKGALVLIMHACEMPQGNYWGKQIATAAINSLGSEDLAGVLSFQWGPGQAQWVYPLSPVDDKTTAVAAIDQMQMGDMPDFGPPMQAAYNALLSANAGQKHIIIISDGDPSMPSQQLLASMRQAKITCSGVAVFPHSPADVASLANIAQATGGRFYNVRDPSTLPQIFIKEAQVIRRSLIVEKPVTPTLSDGLNEIVRGLPAQLPQLDGYVLTGPKGGVSQLLLTTEEDDPILAATQAGLGRCVAFTSTAGSLWAGDWLQWGGYERFWEQVVRWSARPAQSSDCEIFADVDGHDVMLTVELTDPEGGFVQLASISAQAIAPDMSAQHVSLRQAGPGRYRGSFRADQPGSYMVSLQYRKAGPGGESAMAQAVVTVPYAPEFDDLTDNFPLLAEIVATTSGRILPAQAAQADIFSRQGLAFPQTTKPLLVVLTIAWVILFLLDVATRRIAIDGSAIWRRVAGWVTLRREKAQAGQTLDRLRARRQKVRRDRTSRRPRTTTQPLPTDLTPPTTSASSDMPADVQQSASKPDEPPAAADDQPGQTHLTRLLKAKEQARRRRENGKEPNTDKE